MIRSLLAILAVFFAFSSGFDQVAPAQAGHLEVNSRILTFKAACFDLDVLIVVIEATQKSKQYSDNTWRAAQSAGLCFTGRTFRGVLERVVETMDWGDDGPVVVVEVHGENGQSAFTWYTEKFWYKRMPSA
jgi:hypothetical protein